MTLTVNFTSFISPYKKIQIVRASAFLMELRVLIVKLISGQCEGVSHLPFYTRVTHLHNVPNQPFLMFFICVSMFFFRLAQNQLKRVIQCGRIQREKQDDKKLIEVQNNKLEAQGSRGRIPGFGHLLKAEVLPVRIKSRQQYTHMHVQCHGDNAEA